jgi:hypothetical protein
MVRFVAVQLPVVGAVTLANGSGIDGALIGETVQPVHVGPVALTPMFEADRVWPELKLIAEALVESTMTSPFTVTVGEPEADSVVPDAPRSTIVKGPPFPLLATAVVLTTHAECPASCEKKLGFDRDSVTLTALSVDAYE